MPRPRNGAALRIRVDRIPPRSGIGWPSHRPTHTDLQCGLNAPTPALRHRGFFQTKGSFALFRRFPEWTGRKTTLGTIETKPAVPHPGDITACQSLTGQDAWQNKVKYRRLMV